VKGITDADAQTLAVRDNSPSLAQRRTSGTANHAGAAAQLSIG